MFRRFLIAGVIAAVLGFAGLNFFLYPAVPPSHAALKQANLPDIVPLRKFYADTKSKWRYRLSPDGKRLAWLEPKRFKPALWVRNLTDEGAEIYHTPDVVRWYRWSADSRYLLYTADRDGWENDQIVSVDVTQTDAAPRTYDFGSDVKAWIAHVPVDGGSEIVIAHNGINRARFDYYRLKLDTGETSPLHINQDRQVYLNFSREGEVYARTTLNPDGTWSTELKEGEVWHEIANGGMEDQFTVLTQPDELGKITVLSNLGRDKRLLARLDTATSVEEVLYTDDEADLAWVNMHPLTEKPIMAVSYPGFQNRQVFDATVADVIAKLNLNQDDALHLVSATADFTKTIWEVENDRRGWRKYLVDTTTGEVELLRAPRIEERASDLSAMQPVEITSSDGLIIPALLTRPQGVTGPAPLVVRVHGGPVHRASYGYDGTALWLANRGYAVLNVNYRGGSGYGRTFREAAIGEVSRKMHQDIVDARQWAVDQGIADPARVAVMGGSWGGLMVLTAMTETPDLFVAGVDINGISDLSTMLQEVPVYWRGWPSWYRKYLGDPADPAQLEEIRDRSPLYHADKMTGALLVVQGANDVRVIRDQADRMVTALENAGKEVEYYLIKGAGHTYANMGWKRRILLNRRIERFLAHHLGGRADGFDYAVLGAKVLP